MSRLASISTIILAFLVLARTIMASEAEDTRTALNLS